MVQLGTTANNALARRNIKLIMVQKEEEEELKKDKEEWYRVHILNLEK